MEEELMTPIDIYKKEYLGELLKNDIEKYSNIIYYTDVENDFVEYIKCLGFYGELSSFFIKDVGNRVKKPDKIYIWLEDSVDSKYEYTPHKSFTIKFMEMVPNSFCSWYDRIMFSNIPITNKERVKEVLEYVEEYYKNINKPI